MSNYASMIRNLKTPQAIAQLIHLYGSRDGVLVEQTARYTTLIKRHEEYFHTEAPVLLVSAPGRTEIGGNHTDHNKGKVLAAAVNLDTLAAVSPREDTLVHVHSEGYPAMSIDLADLSLHEEEKGTTAALIRGVAARMKELGYAIGGFDAAIHSTVASGSGLSSSAAFEVMTCAILDALYNGSTMDAKTQAKISQYAENVYFGKPSGLLDQMASANGGLVYVDFKHEDPDVRPLAYDFAQKGYALVVVGTGGSHDDLTDEYAAIPTEMKQVAACFGEDCLRRVRPEEFTAAIPSLREKTSDRAVLRALHFFHENDRVDAQVSALKKDDVAEFFKQIIASGRSSYMYLQNVYALKRPQEQSLSVALALAESMLEGKGAWRVHGGGFAGTTLNFVPQAQLKGFMATMQAVFGEKSCHILDIRPQGAAVLRL